LYVADTQRSTFRQITSGTVSEQSPAVSLGDLIYQLFEEAKKVSSAPVEQNLIVYAALKDLLNTKVSSKHPIALCA
jgi:hypothetical protein